MNCRQYLPMREKAKTLGLFISTKWPSIQPVNNSGVVNVKFSHKKFGSISGGLSFPQEINVRGNHGGKVEIPVPGINAVRLPRSRYYQTIGSRGI